MDTIEYSQNLMGREEKLLMRVNVSKRKHLGYIYMPHHTTPPQHSATPALGAAPTSCHTQHVHSPRTPSTTHMTPEITDSSSTKPANHAQHQTWSLLSSRCKIKKDTGHICCCSCANQHKSSTSIPHTTLCRPNPFGSITCCILYRRE